MGSKIISQDAFDDVLKENIVDFSMTPEEARQETIKQFEAQGVNLANIIKDLNVNPSTGEPIILEAINSIQNCLENHETTENSNCVDEVENSMHKISIEQQEILVKSLKVLETECQKSVPHRVLAAKHQAHTILLKLLERELSNDDNSNKSFIAIIMGTLNKLYNKQPDIFNAQALSIMLQLIDMNRNSFESKMEAATATNNDNNNPEDQSKVEEEAKIICSCFQLLQKASIMHEINRQNIIAADIAGYLTKCIESATKFQQFQMLRETLALCRSLVLDDDIRVEFGCAHEHARQLATAHIVNLTNLLKLEVFQKDAVFMGDLLATIGLLAVRQEICKTIYESGGVELIFQVLNLHPDEARLNLEALKLLRALAGNDDVKNYIVNTGVAPILKNILQLHLTNERIVSAALACVSTLVLRVKENSRILFENGLAETIVEAIRLHSKHKSVQRNGAWAIRNMVSRSREQCETWLSFGIEEVLNEALTNHPGVQQDIKIALRDLGCKVELREEWTGVAEKKIHD